MMSGILRAWPVAVAGVWMALAAAGCGREPSVASKSAEEFRSAQKRGGTFAGDGHAHGHGAGAPAAEHGHEAAAAPGGETAHPGHQHGAKTEPAAHAGMNRDRRPAATGEHGGHAALEHGRQAPAPTGPGEHEGHGAMAPQAAARQPQAAGHAGHAPSPAGAPAIPAAPQPAAVPPGQPAATLRPDPLDAPAATSQLDAQRSAAMAREMAGGHGAHGAGTYRQVDAGRGPQAEPATPEHQHDPPDGGGGPAPADGRPS